MPNLFFELAREKLYACEDLSDVLFWFDYSDGEYIYQVTEAVKRLFTRKDLTPKKAFSISKLLLGLSRLPFITPGLDVRISLSNRYPTEAVFYAVGLNEHEFITESGGYMDLGYGADSFSGPTFEVGIGFRFLNNIIFGPDWPAMFIEHVEDGELEINDYSKDSELDWDHDDGSEFWDWIRDNEFRV